MKISYRIQRKSKKLIREYILKKDFIKTTKYGFKIKLDVSRDVDKHFYWGEFEVDIINFLKSLLIDCSVFFDIGANIGIYTLLASKHIRKGGTVYSFEPSDWAYERLMENLQLNESKNVEVLKIAVSNFTGSKQFYICEDDAYNSLISTPMKEVQKVVEVKSISIDDFCIEHKIVKIDILKIDVEGADYLVLKGAQNILRSDKPPLIICEFNRNISEGMTLNKDEFVGFMKELSYKFFKINGKNLFETDLTDAEANELICLKNYHLVKYNLNPKTR
jgi:FkbM family methyltransferase